MNKENVFQKSIPLKLSWWVSSFFWYAGWAVAGLVIVLIMAGNIWDFNIKYMQLPIDVSYQNSEYGLPLDQDFDSGYMPVVGFHNVILDVSNFPSMINNMWIPFVLMLGFLWIVKLLRQFLKTCREGMPFAPENPKRLEQIGWLVTIAGPVIMILNQVYARVYLPMIDLPGAEISVIKEIYPFMIFVGLMILVISQVFKLGAAMKAEQDLTV